MDVIFDPNEQLSDFLIGQSATFDKLWMEESIMSDLYDEITKNDHTCDALFDDERPSEVSLADSIDRSVGGSPCPYLPSPCSSTSIEDTGLTLPDSCGSTQNDVRADPSAQNKAGTDNSEKENQHSRSRGAVMAKRNRERKKEHVAQLESKVSELRTINDELMTENKSLKSGIDRLTQEISYLRNIVKNDTELSKIILAVTSVPGIQMSTSPICVSSDQGQHGIKRNECTEKTNGPLAKMAKHDLSGVCLNVQDGLVSLELCAQCNVSSKKAGGRMTAGEL